MRVAIAVHTEALRRAANDAARRLRMEGAVGEVVVIDLAAPVRGDAPVTDDDGVLHLANDPAIPVIASPALVQGAALAAWLAEWRPTVALLVADAGLAYFALQQRAQGLVPPASRIGCLLTTPPDVAAVGTTTHLTEPVLLERAMTTGAALAAADRAVIATAAAADALARRGWQLPAATETVAAFDAETLVRAVRALLDDARVVTTTSAPSEAAAPRISVCIAHHDRPALLRQALASIAAQRVPPAEVIVVDDGSRDPATQAALDAMAPHMARRGWRLLREPNRFPGAARNTAARHATGTHLLFLDDDDCLRPDAIEVLGGAAAASGADVTAAFVDYFEGDAAPGPATRVHHRWVMPGPCGAQSLLQNDFGTVTALVRREAFEAVGGFREQAGAGFEDWELFLALATAGHRFTVVPRALAWIRWSGRGRMVASQAHRLRSHADALAPVAQALPAVWRDLPALAVGLHAHATALSQRVVELERALVAARAATVPPPALPPRVERGTLPPVRCHVWHTEGLGLSGILAWMWRLRTQFGPATDVDVRLVDLAMQPYGFQQVGADPASLYDERVDSAEAFVAFVRRTAGDVHIVNHAFEPLTALVAALGADAVARLHLVGVCHTDQEFYYANLVRLAPVLRSIVCVSETCARTLAARLPAHAHKLVLLPAWAVTLPETAVTPRPARTPLRLLYTGRIVQYQKRVLDLALLAVELRRARIDATLTIVGDGPDLPALRDALAAVRPHAIPVTLAPVRAPWAMEPLLRAHDAFVQVSEFEGASVSLMEALAHGLLPVVTTTRSGHDLLEAGRNAVVAPVGEMRALAAALAPVARDATALTRMQQAARATAARYLDELAYPERFAGLVAGVVGAAVAPARDVTRDVAA
ncbi:MAG: glycosyltransferase [Gemmatimonadaceae bacterium]|nr:glycosyltransferase [Gemmatimonadaceae bacterium]